MLKMNEHLNAGFKAAVPLFLLVLRMYKTGIIIGSWDDFVGFAAFAVPLCY